MSKKLNIERTKVFLNAWRGRIDSVRMQVDDAIIAAGIAYDHDALQIAEKAKTDVLTADAMLKESASVFEIEKVLTSAEKRIAKVYILVSAALM